MAVIKGDHMEIPGFGSLPYFYYENGIKCWHGSQLEFKAFVGSSLALSGGSKCDSPM